MALSNFRLDSEVSLAGFVGFAALGKLLVSIGTWVGVHAEMLAGFSYILASAAAALTIYRNVTKKK